MQPIRIDAMVGGHQGVIAALHPFCQVGGKPLTLANGMVAIFTGIGTVGFTGVIHSHRMDQ